MRLMSLQLKPMTMPSAHGTGHLIVHWCHKSNLVGLTTHRAELGYPGYPRHLPNSKCTKRHAQTLNCCGGIRFATIQAGALGRGARNGISQGATW